MSEETQTQDPAGFPERARPHHFGFVFKVFYDFCKYDPVKLRTAAKNGQLTQILRHLWAKVGESLPPEDRLPGDDLKAETDENGGRLRVFVILPTVERSFECLYAAVVFKPDGFFNKSKEFTVYTLEKSAPENGEPTWAYCSIGDGGNHGYLGRAMTGNLADFKGWLTKLLSGEK
ncbi:MAG TPA: hypothetical protein V6C81_24460 [Planktothrix sp.]|jgi:hypothetical protein